LVFSKERNMKDDSLDFNPSVATAGPGNAPRRLPGQAQAAEPTVCPQCGAVFHDGRWHGWRGQPEPMRKPARRATAFTTNSRGYVTVNGPSSRIIARNCSNWPGRGSPRQGGASPEADHEIEDQDDGIQITTTDIHLARGIGEALHHAYQGELEYHYNERENLLRVVWER